MSVDRTHGWDRQAAIRQALARLERLPDIGAWSKDAPATTQERGFFGPADRSQYSR